MSHEVDWARVGKMPIKELSLSWLISAGESKSRIQWILLTKKRHGIFRSENTKVQKGHLGSNLGQIFYSHFLETLTEVFVWGWYHRLASEIWKNESFEWFKSHYCINQYCNEHEFILDILEVNIRGRKLSNFRFEFGDFNSKLIHFFGFSQTGSDQFFCWIFRKILILRIWT